MNDNKIIEPGRYSAVAEDAVLGTSKNGTDQIGISFRITDEGDFKGWSITYYGFFSDAAFPYTLKNLRAAGFEGNDLNDLSSINGTECSITVEHDEYDGKVSAKVAWINAPGGVKMANQMGDQQRASFAKRMKAKIMAAEAGQAKVQKGTDFDPKGFDDEDEDFPEDF